MTSRKFNGGALMLIVVVMVIALANRTHRRAPPRKVARQGEPYVHPITPTPPVVNPPPPSCRARDLQGATAAVRELRDNAAAAADSARRPLPKSCRDEPATRAMEAHIDMLGQSVSACVARDAELDSAWNLVQSAVIALQTCADCTLERPARQKACAQATNLLTQTTPPPPP